MKRFIALLLATLTLFLVGCSKTEQPKETEPEKETTTEYVPTPEEIQIQKMTIEEKIAQLFFIMPEALDPTLPEDTKVTAITDTMKNTYKEYPAGGIILFAKNIENPEQLTKLTSDIHALNELTPLIGVDEEGGSITRIAKNENFNVTKFNSMLETKDADEAYNIGKTIGTYLNEYGFDVDFAPVADVNTNPDNPVIGKRAFSADPKTAAKFVSSAIKGFHDANIMTSIKHFPGHGDTQTDTHKGYAETQKTWDEIKNCEMIPFIKGIDAGTDMVMVAHIAAPKVTGDGTPATLSYTLITEKLRNELGFKGVVITDGMKMGAIAQQYDAADAAVKAIEAGIDIILLPENYIEAYNGVLTAVQNGTITEERIDESVMRILHLKLS
ncbi:MAG: glycoside hydrolase family 3 protein [Oscillospiraceae bacterium]|nr:glycoside hydrolase family 3 protein [Candidatus Limimonas coprohippi]